MVDVWLHRIYPHAIAQDESKYIRQREDLTAVLPDKRPWLRRALEKHPAFLRSCSIAAASRELPSTERTIWTTCKSVDRLSITLASVGGLGMLIGPLWILASISVLKAPARRHLRLRHTSLLDTQHGDRNSILRISGSGCSIHGGLDGLSASQFCKAIKLMGLRSPLGRAV